MIFIKSVASSPWEPECRKQQVSPGCHQRMLPWSCRDYWRRAEVWSEPTEQEIGEELCLVGVEHVER